VHAARAHGPLAVKLIAGHGAGGGRRGPRPGRCDQVPNLGTSSRTAGDAGSRPWIIQRTGPRQAARPRERHGRAGRLRFSSPGRGRTSLPGAPAPFPGVTLRDEGVKENARGPALLWAATRRLTGLVAAAQSWAIWSCPPSAKTPIRPGHFRAAGLLSALAALMSVQMLLRYRITA
jgi:hypothetical protein